MSHNQRSHQTTTSRSICIEQPHDYRSLIKKIPGPKKPMGENLQVMLLFQAAQIQRLTQNLQVLNNYRKEMQKGPMNLKSMQIQIKQLTDEIFRKQKQITVLKEKYEAALKNLNEFDISNQQLQKKLREKLMQMRQMKQELHERDLTVSESLKLTDEKEIYIKKLNDSIFFISRERDDLEEKNDEYLDKLALLSQEMVRLRESNNRLKSTKGTIESQLQQAKQQNFSLQSLLQRQRQQNEQLHMMSLKLSEQIEQFKSTITYLKESQEQVTMEKSSHVMMVEQRNEQFFNENNKLKAQLMEFGKLVSEKDHIVNELNAKLQRSIQESASLNKQLARVQQIASRQQDELTSIKQQCRQLQYNLQSQKSYYSQEMSQFESKQKEVQYTKERSIMELKHENEHLNAEISRLGSILQKVSQEKESMNSTLTTNVEELSKQVEERQLIIREKQQQITQFQRTIQQLSNSNRQSVQNYTTKLQQQSKVLEQFRFTNQRLKQQISQLSSEREDILKQISHKEMSQSSISLRYETLMKDIQNKNSEYAGLRKEYEKKIIEVQSKQKEIQAKNQLVQQVKRELQSYQKDHTDREKRLLQENKELQGWIHEKEKEILHNKERNMALQNQLNLVTHELERLNIILREKDQLLLQRTQQLTRRTTYQQQVKHQMKSLQQVLSRKDIELTTKKNDGNNIQQRLLTEILQLKNLVINKEEELARCNDYIERMNQKMGELSEYQQGVLNRFEEQGRKNRQEDYETKQCLHTLLELIKSFKSESFQQYTKINNNVQLSRNNHQAYTHTFQDKLTTIQQLIQHNTTLLHSDTSQLQSYLHQRQQQISTLQRQLQQQSHTYDSHQKYTAILQSITQIKEQNQLIKKAINKISAGSQERIQEYEGQLEGYRQELERKDKNVTELNGKIDLIHHEMQEIVHRSEHASLQLQQYQQLRSRQLHQLSMRQQQNINRARRQTQSKYTKLLAQTQTQLKNKINALKLQNQTLSQENKQLQERLALVEQVINEKKEEIMRFQSMVNKSNEDYVRKNEMQKYNLQNQLKILTHENDKLRGLVKVREEQADNNERYVKEMEVKIIEWENEIKEKNIEIRKLQELKGKVTYLQQQVEQLLQQKQASSITQQQLSAHLHPLKHTINELQSMNNNLHARLQQALSKLTVLSKHLQKLQSDESSAIKKLGELLEVQTKYEDVLKKMETLQLEKSELEMKVVKKQAEVRQYEIQKEFGERLKVTSNVVLGKYESKFKLLVEESEKFTHFIELLEKQNYGLKKENTSISLELKKAQIAQQKIKILSNQIQRLSIQKIDMDSQLTNYRLLISEDSSMERRYQQQLCLMVLMMAQIEALRIRLKNKQSEVELTHRTYTRSMSSSRHK